MNLDLKKFGEGLWIICAGLGEAGEVWEREAGCEGTAAHLQKGRPDWQAMGENPSAK